ncbi:MAG: terpene cyclase/mutase family protein [Candidatus Jacksonbacteria bacterium]|nr:terpene cyclase/mutase family protein [Candidatus Jacksonbacteria bacterium]
MKRKLFASALLALFASATVVVAAPSKNQSATAYLKNSAQNHWSTQALAALGEVSIPSDHLKAVSCDSAIQCAGPILGITALSEDPRSFGKEDLVARIVSFAVNGQLGDPANLNDDIFGILALVSAGVSINDTTINDSKTFLLNNQNADGGFGWIIGSSDVDDTAMAVMALLETGVSQTDDAIQNAVSYIKQAQNLDGGFPYDPLSTFGTNSNANSTAWVMSMIYKLGEDPESSSWSKDENNPVAFLQSLQTPEGWFEYELGAGNFLKVDTTAHSAIALAGASYPVRKIVQTPPPPPPPPPSPGMIIPPSFNSNPLPPEDTEEESSEEEEEEDDTSSKDSEENTESAKDENEAEAVLNEPETPAVLGQKLVVPFADGALLKTPNDPTVYMIEQGRKRWIPNETILRLRFPSPRVIEFVSQETIDEYPEGLEMRYPDQVYLVGETSQKVYLILRGKKYHVRSKEAWRRILSRGDTVSVPVSDREFIKYELGGMVE